MPRTDTEVKSVVEEIKKGFADLKTKAEQKQDQLYRHQAYLEALTKGFPDRIKKTIEITSPAPRTATWQLEGIINQSLTFHVEGLPGQVNGRRRRNGPTGKNCSGATPGTSSSISLVPSRLIRADGSLPARRLAGG